MALLFMESFDGYGGNTSYMPGSVGCSLSNSNPAAPRTGAYHMRDGGWTMSISPATATLIINYAFWWSSGNANSYMGIYAGFGSNAQVFVRPTAAGKIRLVDGANSTDLVVSASTPLVHNSWNYVEAKIQIANSGAYEVKVNGASVMSGTVDTQYQATAAIGSVEFNTFFVSSGFDDIVVMDSSGSYLNDFIGDHKIECLSPSTGNGTNTGLTCSTGSDHGALVDELPPNDDTDYNYGSTIGIKDTYNFPSLSSTGVVKAVQAVARMKKTDSPTKQAVLVARENSTDSDGSTTHTLATSYGRFVQIWEKRPSDNAAWTVADVNGGEFGMKITA